MIKTATINIWMFLIQNGNVTVLTRTQCGVNVIK